MNWKWEILNIFYYRGMNNPVTAKDLLKNPLLIRLNTNERALRMSLLRYVRQGLLKRSGKGGWSDPYRYQLIKKGAERRIHFGKKERRIQETKMFFNQIINQKKAQNIMNAESLRLFKEDKVIKNYIIDGLTHKVKELQEHIRRIEEEKEDEDWKLPENI